MKYRRLELEQLQELEKEFIEFLVINGITADDWSLLKKESAEKADAIIDQFSDVVWEGVLRKCEYLVKYTRSSLYCFKCDESEIHLRKLNDHRAIADLTNPEYLAQAIDGSMHITVQSMSKPYNATREEDIFSLIMGGCEIADSTLYDSIK